MIQPKISTVGEILTPSRQFAIPRFQRPYSWEKSQASEFLDDLQNETGAGRSLFLGTFIFDMSEQGEKTVVVVDGQQRLTTLQILLVACRAHARQIGAEGIVQTTQQRITFVDPATAMSLGPLLIASESIRETFENMTSVAWDGLFPVKLGPKHVKRQVNRVKPIYTFFSHHLANLDQKKLSEILDAIYKIRLIRIDIDGEEEAFNIFERTNARGVDLEVTDLLKNYLYQKGVPELEDKWPEILRNSRGTILRMLKYYYVSQKGYVQKSGLYPKLKAYCGEVGGAPAFVDTLLEFSRFYDIFRREEGPVVVKKFVDSLGLKDIASHADRYEAVHVTMQGLRLFKISQIYPLIFSALQCLMRNDAGSNKAQSKALIRLLHVMENYHFINNAVCDRVGNEVEKLYADFCEKYKVSKDFEKTTQEFIGRLKTQLAREEEFTSRFCGLDYAPQTIALLAYIFDRFNNVNSDPGERVPIFNPVPGTKRKSHNIEHFYPQKPEGDSSLEAEMAEAVDNIGNLLAISFRANSSLGNLSPEKKIEKLTGELAKKIQNLDYVRKFIQKYGRQAQSWNKAAIQARAQDMALEAYRQVWRLD